MIMIMMMNNYVFLGGMSVAMKYVLTDGNQTNDNKTTVPSSFLLADSAVLIVYP